MPARSEDWNLALPIEAQDPAHGRRARRVAKLTTGFVLVLLLGLAVLISIPGYWEARWRECFEVKERGRIPGSLHPPRWLSWPPGWECVFETPDGSITTRYIGF